MRFLYELKKSKETLFRKVAIVASGAIVSQIITLATTPIITRLFSTSDYGMMSVFSSTITILVAMAMLDLHRSIPIIETDEKAANMFSVCIRILIIYSLIICIIVIFAGRKIFYIFQIGEIYSVRFLLPIGVFFVGMYELFLQWVYRKRLYEAIPKTRLTQAVAGAAVKIISGVCSIGPIGLVLGTCIGQGAGISILRNRIYRDTKIPTIWRPLKKDKDLIVEYSKFPIFSLPADIIDTFSNNLPVILISVLYGAQISGLFGLANSVINLPVNLVVVSVSRVVYAEAAAEGKDNPKALLRICKKITKSTFFLSFIGAIVVFIVGPFLFEIIFGAQWIEAGDYAKALMFKTVAFCTVLPIGRMLEVLGLQKYDLAICFSRLICIIVSIAIIKYFNLTAITAVTILSIINMISYLILYVVILSCLRHRIQE